MSKASSCPTFQPSHRILVVNDDGDIRQLSAEVLGLEGYEVHAAADGEAAWQALNTERFDLVITGHEMPKLTGFDLLKKVHAARMALPVIMTSAKLPREEFVQYPWLIPAAMLPMPYTVAEYLGTVREVLYATRAADEQTVSQTGDPPGIVPYYFKQSGVADEAIPEPPQTNQPKMTL
jgi:DNA-binding NtrC family response regulator